MTHIKNTEHNILSESLDLNMPNLQKHELWNLDVKSFFGQCCEALNNAFPALGLIIAWVVYTSTYDDKIALLVFCILSAPAFMSFILKLLRRHDAPN